VIAVIGSSGDQKTKGLTGDNPDRKETLPLINADNTDRKIEDSRKLVQFHAISATVPKSGSGFPRGKAKRLRKVYNLGNQASYESSSTEAEEADQPLWTPRSSANSRKLQAKTRYWTVRKS
jgi:hypothetical protein